MAKRYKPSVRALCSLRTLAHNRTFKSEEIGEYLGMTREGTRSLIGWLREHGHIQRVSGARKRSPAVNSVPRWAPTRKGWTMIEKACRR